MKKILLPALFCGFVLNNGYCVNGEHKITNEYLDESFGNLEKVIYDNVPYLVDTTAEWADNTRFVHSVALLSMAHITYYVDKMVCDNLKKFAEEFLTSKIPSCWYIRRTVASLLRNGNLDDDALRTICDDSVKFWIKGNEAVLFELSDGTDILITHHSDRFSACVLFPDKKFFERNDINVE